MAPGAHYARSATYPGSHKGSRSGAGKLGLRKGNIYVADGPWGSSTGVLDHLQPPFRHTIAIGMVWAPRLGGEGPGGDLALERGQFEKMKKKKSLFFCWETSSNYAVTLQRVC